MAWNLPGLFSIGQILTAANMNGFRDSLMETAPAVVTTVGDLVRADGANSLVRFALPATPSGQILRARVGGAVWEGLPFDVLNELDASYSHTITTPTIPAPSTASNQGTLATGLASPSGITWGVSQFVIVENNRDVWTLADATSPGDAADQGSVSSSVAQPRGVTWNGTQYVMVGDAPSSVAIMSDPSTPSGAVSQGNFLAALQDPRGITWDGGQYVVLDDNGNELWTLANAASPGDVALQGTLPGGLTTPKSITFDGVRYLIGDDGSNSLWALEDAGNPGSATNLGAFPAGLSGVNGITWDGTQVVILNDFTNDLWTLAPQFATLATLSTTAVGAGLLVYDLELDAGSVSGADVILQMLVGGNVVASARGMGNTVSAGPACHVVASATDVVLRLVTTGAAAGSCDVDAKFMVLDTS